MREVVGLWRERFFLDQWETPAEFSLGYIASFPQVKTGGYCWETPAELTYFCHKILTIGYHFVC